MTRSHPSAKKWHVLSIPAWLGLMLAVLTTMLLPPAPMAQAASAIGQEPVLSEAEGPVELHQFTAGGHVLGFRPDGAYVVGSDHMLKVTFASANDVAPVADQPPSSDGLAQPLGRVTYQDLWDGISLTYQQVTGGIAKSSYLLDSGAAVDQIRLRYNVPVQVDAGGRLLFGFETSQMSESAPVAWQEIARQRVPVAVSFRLLAEREVSFALGEYDPAYPLIIDPTLQWNTFMGSSWDEGYGIAVDGSGNVYVTGWSLATWGSPVNPHAGHTDAFAAKLNSSGVRQWHIFMGSSDYDYGYGIAVDGSGNVYVVGRSEATWGSPVNPHAGREDAFAAKLNSSGIRQWHTFMGSSMNIDEGRSIAVDGSGNVYVAGRSTGTWGSPVNAYAGGAWDAFAAKLNSSGVRQWNTFMGSPDWDYGWSIAVDGSGNVYVAGESWATWGSPVNAHAGYWDAFAAKLNSSGVRQWHTFMGSSDYDSGYGIAVDGSGNVYLAGWSYATWGSPVNAFAGSVDAFAAKLNSSGIRQWHTFMGSSNVELGQGIAVDGSGNVYVAGWSYATWGSPVNPHAGSTDAFAVKLDSSGVRQWNTFMGSSSKDYGRSIAADGSGSVYVTGHSEATWGSPVNAHAWGSDVFAAKLGPLSISKTVDPNTDITYHGEATYTIVLNNSDVFSATGTLLTDTLPSEVDFAHWVEQPVGASFDPGPPEEITWSGTASASTAITFTFVVTHVGDFGDVVTNTAEYSHTTGSGDDHAIFTVESPSLGITKTVTPTTNVTYHGEVTYTVVLNNSGTANASGTLLTDTLPGEVDFVSWVEQPAGANQINDQITWNGTVSASEAITFTFVVMRVGAYGDVVTNTAEYRHTTGSGDDDAIFNVLYHIYLPIVLKGAQP
jgi:uncharacterized repeat protein (TIGR01451 family)